MYPLLLILAAAVGVGLLIQWTEKKGWTSFRGNGRGIALSALDPWNQAVDARRRAAQVYVEQMQTGHDQKAESQGDGAPGAEPEDAFERAVRLQMTSPEAYLRRRGARGKQPYNGARV